MFTHIIEFNIKVDRRDTLLDYFEKETVPVLKTAPGFLDITLMHYEEDIARNITVCFWETREHCMKFVTERLPKLLEPVTEHLVRPPEMRSLVVDKTTIRKVLEKAA